MKKLTSVIITFLFVFNGKNKDSTFNMHVDETQSIHYSKDIISIDVSERNIIIVSTSSEKRLLSLKAVKPGNVFVTVKLKDSSSTTYNITVKDKDYTTDALSEVKKILKKIPGTTYHIEDQSIVISGEIYTAGEGLLFEQLLTRFADSITDKTTKPYQNYNLMTLQINKILEDKNLSHYFIKNIGKIMYIVGSPKNDAEKKIVLDLVKLINPDIKDGISSKNQAPEMIIVDVLFLEKSHHGFKQYGLERGRFAKADSTLGKLQINQKSFGSGALSLTIGPLDTMLNMVEEYNNSKVLSNPRIIVQSGKKAKFKSGAEVFVDTYEDPKTQTLAGVTSTVQEIKTNKVEAGLNLEVTATKQELNIIDLIIKIESSDFSTDIDGNSGKIRSSTDTSISLKSGYSVLLSGFKKQDKKKNVQRIPFISDIPIIGEVFKYREFKNATTDLLVLLTVTSSNIVTESHELFDMMDNKITEPKKFTTLKEKSTSSVSFSIFD